MTVFLSQSFDSFKAANCNFLLIKKQLLRQFIKMIFKLSRIENFLGNIGLISCVKVSRNLQFYLSSRDTVVPMQRLGIFV